MRYKLGYTLIELLVGLTIIGILFGVGFAGFRDFSRRQSLSSLTKKVMGDLRLTQATVGSGKKPDDSSCNTPNILTGYSVFFDDSNYTISAICSGGDVVTKTVDISSDITITPPQPNPIIFSALGNGTNIVSGQNATITFTQNATESTSVITIGDAGDIK